MTNLTHNEKHVLLISIMGMNVEFTKQFSVRFLVRFLKFVGIAFISLSHGSIISSHVITESSKVPAKYLPFSP